MGQCYFVEAKFNFKNGDPSSFCKVIENEVKTRDGKSARFRKHTEEDFLDPFKCFTIIAPESYHHYSDKNIWCASFNASYGWEQVMYEIFTEALKETDEGSYVSVWPDYGSWKIYIKNGEVKEIEEEDDKDL